MGAQDEAEGFGFGVRVAVAYGAVFAVFVNFADVFPVLFVV